MHLGTYSIIKCFAGTRTGRTFIGNGMWIWSNDGVSGVHYGQYRPDSITNESR